MISKTPSERNDEQNEASIDRRFNQTVSIFESGDIEGTIFRLKSLAKQNDGPAIFNLAQMYHLGAKGFEPDHKKAEYWYKKAIYDHEIAIAYFNLAFLYISSQQIEHRFSKALSLLQDIEEEFQQPAVWYLIAYIYEGKHNHKKDLAVAINYYKKALSLGHERAGIRLGVLLMQQGEWAQGLKIFVRSVYNTVRIAARDPKSQRIKITWWY